MAMFLASTSMGVALYKAPDEATARRYAQREAGTYNFQSIRPATKADVNWVEAMGGYVPK